jgi:Pup amidohydrolase
MGLETEFCIRRSACSSSARRPSTKEVCRAILDALERVVDVAPGQREGWPRYQRFVQNGGAFSFEVTRPDASDGVLESATPECRGASQLLLYERAQEALIQRALPLARSRLAAAGYDSDIAIVKNGRDAEGHVYGAQENYEAGIARGWRLLAYRLALAALVPAVLCWCAAIILASAFAFVGSVVVLLVFPVARHWVGLDPYSRASSGDAEPDPSHIVLRIAAAAAMPMATVRRTCHSVAPRATRMPISRVRRVTMNDSSA